jgi:hypothetical protein
MTHPGHTKNQLRDYHGRFTRKTVMISEWKPPFTISSASPSSPSTRLRGFSSLLSSGTLAKWFSGGRGDASLRGYMPNSRTTTTSITTEEDRIGV